MTKDLDKKVAHAMELHYERGFIDGMQKQMQSSVDKAVNRMAQTQEPVAEYIGENWDGSIVQLYEDLPKGTKLYTSPPQRTEQELVAWGVFGNNLHDMFFTEEEAQEMARLKGDGSVVKPLFS